VETFCPLPSPSKMLPREFWYAPLDECILYDQETAPRSGMATSLPCPFLGEKP
jgi:hypothetical protein